MDDQTDEGMDGKNMLFSHILTMWGSDVVSLVKSHTGLGDSMTEGNR